MYSKEERETILLNNDEDKEWDIYTRQPRVMKRMKDLNISPYKTETEDGVIIAAYYKLDLNQVSFRKKVVLSEEEKEKRRQNMIKNSQNRK